MGNLYVHTDVCKISHVRHRFLNSNYCVKKPKWTYQTDHLFDIWIKMELIMYLKWSIFYHDSLMVGVIMVWSPTVIDLRTNCDHLEYRLPKVHEPLCSLNAPLLNIIETGGICEYSQRTSTQLRVSPMSR